VSRSDLKVRQLAVAGNGLLIDPGAAIILNRYQTTPNQSYAVLNPATHTVLSSDMPASNPATKYYLVCVTIGDPEFSQVGHPWMGAGDPPVGEAETFQYVRPFLVECTSSTTSFSQLALAYPAIALARIAVPPSTTTITDAMITDLRHLASPRQSQELFIGNPWTNGSPVYIPSGSAFADWGAAQYAPTVKVPAWATRAIMSCRINGVGLVDTSVNINGNVRAQLGSVSGPSTSFDVSVGGGAIRMNLEAAGTYNVTSIAGTTAVLRVEGYESTPASPTTNQRLKLQSGSQQIFDVRFFEE
jgi:hypothetical protein